MTDTKELHPLNAVCPYFTMFPLSFPLGILQRHATSGDRVLDPFCGRGTTNFAARTLGLESVGVDSSPVAHAIAASKIANVGPDKVIGLARAILQDAPPPAEVPDDEFWRLAYHPSVLLHLCQLREALQQAENSDAHVALRAIVMGALHGPQQKTFPSYFSNQCPRTYAPKPRYAANFWRTRSLEPQPIDVLGVIERRARRYYADLDRARGRVLLADSRHSATLKGTRPVDWIITSPPYYGMKTYVSDQWLRHWFVGGSASVDYAADRQLAHTGAEVFAEDLRSVWQNVARVARPSARLVIRFGGINNRSNDPREIIKASLHDTEWRIQTLRHAGTAATGKRQADQFMRTKASPLSEYDVWAVRRG